MEYWLSVLDKFLDNLLKMLTLVSIILQIWLDLNDRH